MPSRTFAELGVSPELVSALSKRGITEPFAIQSLVIGDLLEDHDVLAKAPTGSGKTLAFAVPVIDRIDPDQGTPSALVLCPTRELAVQIVEESRPLAAALGLRVAAVYGGVGLEEQAKRARRAHMIVATPGRLIDQLQRRAFDLRAVEFLVLDEADRMLDMGFRPDVDRIVRQIPDDRQTMFFSATLDGEAGKAAKAYTYEPRRHEHMPEPEDIGKVEHRFVGVTHEEKLDAVVAEIEAERGERTLVFVRTKRGADRLAKRLDKRGLKVAAMHGDKSQNQRQRALNSFEAGKVDALVATDVAARGIDVRDIKRVINFDPPGDHQAYVHRVGRTARAGRSGIGVTFVSELESADVEEIVRELSLEQEFTAAGFPMAERGGRPHAQNGASRNRGGGNRNRNRNRRRNRSGSRR
ncbi:DEAD/DEAH box helicase [Thermoleophilia bacterium SCSIO 60948]|nr:DEAD/DEAH box helicase [Thermoleophilia bacterium SCSIO 60948]